MSILESLEKRGRSRIHAATRQLPPPSLMKAALIAFIFWPMILFEFFFVPLLGQVVVALSVIVTARYLWLIRSPKLLLTIALSIIASSIATSLFWAYSSDSNIVVIYFLFGICTISVMSYTVIVAAALWQRYEAGAERARSNS